MSEIKLSELMDASVHFGHKVNRWNPKMLPYIYGENGGIHIIDLIKTKSLLQQACDFLKKRTKQDKKILFIGTKRQTASIIKKEAQHCNAFYINNRWLGGTLTNWVTIKKCIKRLNILEEVEKNTQFKNFPKKESYKLKKELNRLRKYFSGIKNMEKKPDIIIIANQKADLTAIKEARKLGISIISLLDTNCNPELADIPIPANDDATKSIQYIIGKLADSIYYETTLKE
ncbi:MAG: 30S ribosomal protein S2 [Alphaproteobacteria bacterium]|nr:30S ribosomal protein S2 [Alphaproteobacteria bacterium]